MANLIIIDAYSLTQLVDQLNRLVQAFRDAVIRVVNAENSEFNDALDKFEDNIITIIQNGTLGDELNTLFTSYLIVGETALDQYNLSKELFTFSDTDTPNSLSTNEVNNSNTVRDSVQIFSLASAFDTAAQIEYGNTSELDSVITELNNQYEKVVDQNIDADTKLSLLELKTNTFSFFSDLELSSIIDIETTLLPSSVIAYKYYEDSSRASEIINLNNILNTGFVEGDIKIVSAS